MKFGRRPAATLLAVFALTQTPYPPPGGRLSAADADDTKPLAAQLKRIPPLEPRQALATFRLEHGFSLELVACEPDVVDPVDACFDEDGRMYVAEMRGYPYSAEPRQQCPEGIGRPDAGTIRLLEDTDGDGRMDKSTVFADEISWPTSVCCYDGGVFVIAPPHIYYLKDTSGDNVADVRQIVYSGFSRANVQALPNNLKWHLDNHIYVAGGRNGAELTHRGEKLFSLGRRDIRFDPRTERLEAVSGGLQFGHSMDDWGNRFVCSNSNHMLHVVFREEYLSRNAVLAVSGVVRSIAKEGGAAPVFRRSPAEPWRVVRTRRRAADPKYANRLPKTELVPIGFFTSATGVTIYRGGAYPAEFRGNAFIGDVGGNLVHRKNVRPDGASFIAERADRNTEFLTSTDNWFRPVNFVNAPDGTLYILDMYRETIEHPYSIPADIKAYLDLESGHDRGRIWRIVPPGFKRTVPPALGDASAAELVAQLESPNSWNRLAAQRLLWERQDKSAVPLLKKLAATSQSPLARLHALWCLDGLNSLPPRLLSRAMNDADAHVREHAVRLAEPFLPTSAELCQALARLSRDGPYRVRFQVAFSIGEARADDALPVLAEMAARPDVDRDLRTALLSSVNKTADRLTVLLMNDRKRFDRVRASGMLDELLLIVGADEQPAAAIRLLSAITSENKPAATQQAVVEGVGRGLARRGSSISALMSTKEIDAGTRGHLQSLFAAAGRTAIDESASLSERKSAVALLAFADFPTANRYLPRLLSPLVSRELQLAAAGSLAEHRQAEVGATLLNNWRSYSPEVRREVVDALLGRTNRVPALLEAVGSGAVKPGEIERDKKELLLNHPNDAVRTTARKLFGGDVTPDRTKVVADYQKVLDLQADATRGRAVFLQKCAVCHKVGSEGSQVGPELASTQNKSPADLLLAILDPNREAQPNYTNYTLVTKEGKVVTGMIAAESAGSITLRRAEGKQDTVLRSNIDSLTSSGKSIMPEGLEKDLGPQQLADVIAFVKTIRPTK